MARRHRRGSRPRTSRCRSSCPSSTAASACILVGHKDDAVWHARTAVPALGLRAGRRRHPPRGDAGRELCAPPRHPARRAQGRHRPRQLSHPRRPARQRRRLRRAAVDGARFSRLSIGCRRTSPGERQRADRAAAVRPHQRPSGARRAASPFPLARYRELFATLPEQVQRRSHRPLGRARGRSVRPRRQRSTSPRSSSATSPSCCSPRAATTATRPRAITIPISCRRTPISRPISGCATSSAPTRSSTTASTAISSGCRARPRRSTSASYPAALWGELPHLYPFIVNDPGEGTQAKRRTGAVIIDHLVPPLTRAETYGPLKDLEALLDEYYAASGMDRRRLRDLRKRILDFARDERLDRDIGAAAGRDRGAEARSTPSSATSRKRRSATACTSSASRPTGRLERDLIVALARVPRGERAGDASLIRALADDLKLGFDPLTRGPGRRRGPGRTVPQPILPASGRGRNWSSDPHSRRCGRTPRGSSPPSWSTARARSRLDRHPRRARHRSRPSSARASPPPARTRSQPLLDGLDGKFIAPGPSGAPSRGRLDVLPTGRNFYSVDIRAVPTPTAWELGKKSAESAAAAALPGSRHAAALARAVASGAPPTCAPAATTSRRRWPSSAPSRCGTRRRCASRGYEIIPLAKLGRPRVDVTLRISGFFRDAFPAQIALFDRAVRAIGALDEPEDQNPIAARMRTDALGLMRDGASEADSGARAPATASSAQSPAPMARACRA